jgi:HKD family nuclease
LEFQLVENSRRVVADALEEVFAGADSARVAVAYARDSGLEQCSGLRRLAAQGAEVRFLAGVDFQLTDLRTLDNLGKGPGVEARVYWLSTLQGRKNFHPKLYLGVAGREVRALVGSSNFTSGGLRSNVEANLLLRGTVDEAPAKDLLKFHEDLWRSPLALTITAGVREAYLRLQERRRLIEADLVRHPDFDRARAAVNHAVAEATVAATAPDGRATWLLVTSPENYSLCRSAGMWGDERQSRIAQMSQGDLLVFYVSGTIQLGMLAIVTSAIFEDSTPYWPDRIYAHRLRFLPLAEPAAFLPFRPLVPQLQLFRDIGSKNFGQALQQAQRRLTPEDAALLRTVILDASNPNLHLA